MNTAHDAAFRPPKLARLVRRDGQLAPAGRAAADHPERIDRRRRDAARAAAHRDRLAGTRALVVLDNVR